MLINKFIIHVLDKNSDSPILNDFEGEINEEVQDFLEKHINRALKDDNTKKAKFMVYDNLIKKTCENIIYDSYTFVENTKIIANELFKTIKSNVDMQSCDLVFCLFSQEDDNYIGILNLDYKKSYTHTIEFVEDKFKVSIIPNEIGLPSATQKLKKCAFIGLSGINDDYHLEVLDKDEIFTKNFLNAQIIMDDKDKTKIFKNCTEKWLKSSLYDDIHTATAFRENLEYTLVEKDEINVTDFVNSVIEEEDLKESFMEHIVTNGIEDEAFSIDKAWVEKNLRRKSIKTNTGFELKATSEDFKDYFKYQIKKNSDGSVDLVLKNIKYYEEK